jgi:DNA polymerase-3 subunit epsilon
MYPSTLEAVYKRCTGKNLEGAHNAINDVEATIEVYKSLRDENIVVDESAFNIVSPEGSIRKVVIDDVESLVFSFGKYKDDEFFSVYKKDPQYVKWFLSNIASDYTFNILKKYCQERKNNK